MMHGLTNWVSWRLHWAHSRLQQQFAMGLLQLRTQQSQSGQRNRGSIAKVDETKEAITVQSLVDMTSGIEWTERLGDTSAASVETQSEMDSSPDWVKFILDRPMSSAPGDIFNYNSGNPHLLSAIL